MLTHWIHISYLFDKCFVKLVSGQFLKIIYELLNIFQNSTPAVFVIGLRYKNKYYVIYDLQLIILVI